MHAVLEEYKLECTLYLEEYKLECTLYLEEYKLECRLYLDEYKFECTLYLGTTRKNARCTSGLHVRMHAVPQDYT
jgi:hypothetical protein